MDYSSFLEIAGVAHANVRGRKQLLKALAAAGAELANLNERELHRLLSERAKFYALGLAGGVCISHVYVQGVERVRGICLRLTEMVDFGSNASRKADTVFLLLSPFQATPDSLKALALVTRALRDPVQAASVRAADTAETLRRLLCGTMQARAA
ncbi:MAG: PTS sugar transporter subunit IIA [Alphaproteobacteria bacterium]|nr:PTS sugar transporter subunit IIA [Alphaproteobacteria bacterium]